MDLGFHYVTQHAFGYWQSQLLFVLVRLRVFDRLSGRPQSPAEVTGALGLDPEAGARLLHAGVAVKFLKLEDGLLANTDVATRFLVSDSPETLVHWVGIMDHWTAAWGQLRHAVRGAPAVDPALARLVDDPDYRRDFVLGMHEYARRFAPVFARAVAPLVDGRSTLLDVGGGAGTYSMALCEAHPTLRATILDLDDVLAVARPTIARSPAADRIETRAIDYSVDRFGAEADVVLLSNVLHQESAEMCRDMLARAHAALVPGGRVIVQSLLLGEDRVSPTFATLHNLSALVLWRGGRSYTAGDICRFLDEAGFRDLAVQAMPANAESVVSGSKEER